MICAVSAVMMFAFSGCENVENAAVSSSVPESFSEPDTVTEEQTDQQITDAVSEDTSETSTEAETENTKASPESKGNIYDTDGRLLVYSTDNGGSYLRHVSDDYAVSLANIITTMSDGYDTAFDDILSKGDSIVLTIDAEIQKAVYDYMEANNIVGSVVVMRTDGSIMVQASYPSYDPNAVTDQKYDEELAWGKCGNKAFQNYEPGSCFKIMSEVIADKHGIYSLYDDGEWVYDDTSIVNWDHDTNPGYPIPERSLSSAFINSSNIFFAKAFDQIGGDAVLEDLESIFHFVSPIDCDFGEINNNVEFYCEDDVRRTAFGQSYVLTCPLYLSALGREAVFGDMVRPYVLESVVDTGSPDRIIADGSLSNDVLASIPSEYRQNLLDGMLGVAGGLGIYLPDGYTLYAKTGTAETWLGDFLYITGCAKNANDSGSGAYDHKDYNGSYVVVMNVQNPEYHGFSFASESARLYQGVLNCVVGN